MENLLVRAQEIITLYGINLVAALLIFILGRWAAKLIRHTLLLLMKKAVKKKFDLEGISIPFPQRDIHLFEHK